MSNPQKIQKSGIEKPLISIITVAYNEINTIEETIQSVINQTYEHVEYIIIDGGSTDGTVEILQKYQNSIDYWVSEKDRGLYDAMNKGIRLATGEWINFMNAGDYFLDQTILGTVANDLDSTYNVVSGKALLYYQNAFIGEYGNEKIFPHQASFFKLTDLKKTKFDLEFKFYADSELLQRIKHQEGFRSKFINIPVCKFFLGGIGNHPNYFFARFREEVKLKKKNKSALTFSWFIFTSLNALGYLFWKLFGEKKYYLVFVKSLLAIIDSKQKNQMTQ